MLNCSDVKKTYFNKTAVENISLSENGILDFEKANILEIPPFNSIGKPTKIIKLFGGKVAFEQAIRELEYQIYKSA